MRQNGFMIREPYAAHIHAASGRSASLVDNVVEVATLRLQSSMTALQHCDVARSRGHPVTRRAVRSETRARERVPPDARPAFFPPSKRDSKTSLIRGAYGASASQLV